MKFFSFSSYPSLKNGRVLTTEAMLLALYLALGFFTLSLSPTLRVTFSFLAMALSCYFFGFWPNVPFAFAADLFGYLLRPDGAYMPLFILVAVANAAIYSFFFYPRKEVKWYTVLLAKAVQVVLCNLLLNPLILQLMYQTPFWSLLLSRVIKNLIQFPLDVVLLFLVLRFAQRMVSSRSWLAKIKEKAVTTFQ